MKTSFLVLASLILSAAPAGAGHRDRSPEGYFRRFLAYTDDEGHRHFLGTPGTVRTDTFYVVQVALELHDDGTYEAAYRVYSQASDAFAPVLWQDIPESGRWWVQGNTAYLESFGALTAAGRDALDLHVDANNLTFRLYQLVY